MTSVWYVQDMVNHGWFWVGCFNPGGFVYTRVDTECYFICSLDLLSVGVQMKMMSIICSFSIYSVAENNS
jgi:hypothetical protein